MTAEKAHIGALGEKSAADFIIKQGFRIRGTNYRKPYGEIDIIAEKDRVLHFIEVKASKYYTDSAFTPEMRIDRRKARNLKKICETYLREAGSSLDQEWQIDVISVILDSEAVLGINFIENAVFEPKS